MNYRSFRALPETVWIVFAGFCFLGIAIGLLGGAGELSDVLFVIALFGTPAIFMIWAVASLDRRGLGQMTGHDRWRSEQRLRDREIGLSDDGDGANAITGDGNAD